MIAVRFDLVNSMALRLRRITMQFAGGLPKGENASACQRGNAAANYSGHLQEGETPAASLPCSQADAYAPW